MPTSSALKKPVDIDWHSSDVKAALDKKGWSLRQLGFANGYSGDSTLSEALRRPWPKAERIIAKAIGVTPQQIWPSRYNPAGQPNRPAGRTPKRPSHISVVKATTAASRRNTQKADRE